MDYSDSFKYFVFRLVLLVGTDVAGLVVGKILLWVIASVLPPVFMPVKNFLVDDVTGSVVAALVMAGLLALVFRDDAVKHAAYENMDLVLVTVTAVLLLGLYFIPVIFYNPADMTKVKETVYYFFYYPCHWLREIFGADFKTAAAVGMAIILGGELVVYDLTFTNYKKKHPFNFKESAAEI